jgi:hypothetical protein
MKQAGLARMMAVKAKFPLRIVGAFGRDWKGSEPQYIRKAVPPGPCRIALTILMLTDRDTCQVHSIGTSGRRGREEGQGSGVQGRAGGRGHPGRQSSD